jgi:transposase
MKIELSTAQKNLLETRHQVERDGRVRDRIKAVLLKSEGWTNKAIGQALRIHSETVAQHLRDWNQEEKLSPQNGGSQSKLTEQQAEELEIHLQEKVYLKVVEICSYVAQTWKIEYSVSGMTKWLKSHRFRYKKPKGMPAKADAIKQKEFIERYSQMVQKKASNETILFIDAVHPTMATKISCGWIKKGQNKTIATVANKTRVNIIGAIELKSMNVVSDFVETVNADSIKKFFEKVKVSYPEFQKIHIILDQSGYHRSQAVKDAALAHGIELHYLPPYSPNLNPIERLWKVMNERVRNNVVFESAQAFRQQLSSFFDDTILKIKDTLFARITDKFQTICTVPSG